MTITIPASRSEWEADAATARATLWQLLGDLPPTFTPMATITSRTEREGCIVESLEFDNGAGAMVYGTLLLPPNLSKVAPAVLFHHLHGGKYVLGKDELWSEDVIGFAPGYCSFTRREKSPVPDARSSTTGRSGNLARMTPERFQRPSMP